MTDRPSACVDADDVRRVVATYAEQGHDLVTRAGCPPERASAALLAGVERLVDALADDPTDVGNLLGYWLRMSQDRAAPAGTASGIGDRRSILVPDPVDARIDAALRALDWDSARLLLLRDAYDLPLGSVAVATGTDLGELPRRTGTARMAFLREYAPAAVRLLLELPACGADVGGLAGLCDSTAPPGLGAELRRHAYRCQRCEETAELQRRTRRILSRLSLRPLDPPAHAALVSASGRLAEARLPVLDAMLDGKPDGVAAPDGPGRSSRRAGGRAAVRPSVVGAALAAALITGLLTGTAIGLGHVGSPPGDGGRTVTVQRDPQAPAPVPSSVRPTPRPS